MRHRRRAIPVGVALARVGLAAGLAAGLAGLAPGCAVGPDYERPTIGVGKHLPEIAAVATSSEVRLTEDEPWARWWEVFRDPELDLLVRDALEANQDLRAALSRVQTARSLVREAFAPLLPKIGTIGAYQYVRLPPNAFGANSGSSSAGASSQPPAFSGQPFQTWTGLGSLSYELDFWGRVRRSLESQNAEELATEEDRKTLEISVIADVAGAYFDVGEASAEGAIELEGVATREETLEIVKRRVATGFATELDQRRAEGELASARAQVPDAEARRAVAEHRLAILTGRLPDGHVDGRPPAEFETPPEIPVGVPATLLERRPDIRAAESRLASQNAKIGQAIAGFFPQFTLQGYAGYASLDLWKIAQPASQLYAAGPVVRLPLFQGGLTYAQVLEAESRTNEAEANYHAAILRAFGEVADAVVRLATDRRIRDEQAREVEADRQALLVARVQYRPGPRALPRRARRRAPAPRVAPGPRPHSAADPGRPRAAREGPGRRLARARAGRVPAGPGPSVRAGRSSTPGGLSREVSDRRWSPRSGAGSRSTKTATRQTCVETLVSTTFSAQEPVCRARARARDHAESWSST